MKKIKSRNIIKGLFLMLMTISLVGLINCSDDGRPTITETGARGTFVIDPVGSSDVRGTATFIQMADRSTKIIIQVTGTTAGNSHPVHIHDNTAIEGGDIAITLNPIDGETGISETLVIAKDDTTYIPYSELIIFDGYLNVHQSVDDLGTIIGQVDIGINALTGKSTEYSFEPTVNSDVTGKATFHERLNGEALAVLELNNTTPGVSHPAHIHSNTFAEGGRVVISFNPVDGTTGISRTNIAIYDNGASFDYSDLRSINAHIDVHLSTSALRIFVAQGDVGQNMLTGASVTYDLGSVAIPEINGTATFYERVNGQALAKLVLNNTPQDGSHPAHIHANSAEVGGPIIFTFNPVNGDSGISDTNVDASDDGSTLGYDDIKLIDGHINVHLSADEMNTLVAQGNIGIN
ncbi:MAG: hypothetical protein RIA69_19335 [Cyclobacteriaceae bacterium]